MDSGGQHHGLSNAEKAALLRCHPLFKEFAPAICERLAAQAKTRTVPRGAMIFAKGDAGSCLFAVVSGTVQVTTGSSEGKSAVFNQIGEGEIFGEIALLDGEPRTADAVAFTDCRLMIIERRDFLPLLRNFPDVAIKLMELLCARLRRTTEQVEDLMFLDLKGRLTKALLRLARQSEDGKGITISQTDLSQMIGMSREMINKQLQAFARDGIIEIERRRIVVLRADVLARIPATD
jgi:CRP/FNR family transcriptional regulator, cyclic AMP receptor protein